MPLRNAAREASFIQAPITPLPWGRRDRISFTHSYFVRHFIFVSSKIKKEMHFHISFSSDLFTVSLCSHTPYQLLFLRQRNFLSLYFEFIALRIKDCMLHKVLKIKDFYVSRRCINTIVSICVSLSKLKLISSAMIGSLNLMDLSH